MFTSVADKRRCQQAAGQKEFVFEHKGKFEIKKKQIFYTGKF
jgi:hypothetical protein